MRRIAVITPVFNRPKMLLCAARSVLSQKLPKGYRLQYVIVDDGSSDRTHDVMQKLVNDHDSIVPLYRNREQGGPLTASNALNHGIAYLIDQDAVDYICYLHSDDILTPDSLLERANVLSSDPSIDWCYGNTDRWFADSGQVKRNIYIGRKKGIGSFMSLNHPFSALSLKRIKTLFL